MFTKQIETGQGDTAEYWAVRKIEIRTNPKRLEVVLGLWKNKNKYDNGKTPYDMKSYVLTGDQFPLSNTRLTNVLEDIRAKIIEVDAFFDDAIVD